MSLESVKVNLPKISRRKKTIYGRTDQRTEDLFSAYQIEDYEYNAKTQERWIARDGKVYYVSALMQIWFLSEGNEVGDLINSKGRGDPIDKKSQLLDFIQGLENSKKETVADLVAAIGDDVRFSRNDKKEGHSFFVFSGKGFEVWVSTDDDKNEQIIET